jgi:hypothetical protein
MDINLERFKHNETVKLVLRPCIVLRNNGASYLNKKAASILNINNGDIIAFYNTPDLKNWYIGPDEIGVTVLKNRGLYRFCDTKLVKKIFASYNIQGNKAFFPVSEKLEQLGELKVLYIIPKPFNID